MVAARRPFPRLLAWTLVLGLSVAGLSGCSAWKKQRGGVEAILARRDPPRKVRVTLLDGSRVEFQSPAIRGDSLVGNVSYAVHHESRWDETRRALSGVPLADIRRVELRKFDAGRTLLLVGIGVGATVAIVAIAHQDDPKPIQHSGNTGSIDDWCLMCSCPLIYSWDGRDYVLDSGTFGGAFLRPLAATDIDNLEALKSADGVVRLHLRAGDQETDHIDELALLAVDHDPAVTIAADPDGRLHTISDPVPPIAARDNRGRDALRWVEKTDGKAWESPIAERDTSVAEDIRDALTLEFRRPLGAQTARLILRGQKTAWAGYLMRSFVRAHGSAVTAWYDAMDADSAGAALFRHTLEDEVHLNVSTWEGGRWVRQSSIWGGGPEIAKIHAVPLDLSGITGDVVRVRLESAPSFWLIDWAALDAAPERPFTVHDLVMGSAVAADGRDVRAALQERDGTDLVLEVGDQIQLSFAVPDAAPGKARTYLSRAHGWYRFHAPETGPADTALLRGLLRERHGISKTSVAWMNRALLALNSGG
jgi:hypothetical protein